MRHSIAVTVKGLVLLLALSCKSSAAEEDAHPNVSNVSLTNHLPVLVKVIKTKSKVIFSSYEGDGYNFRLKFADGPVVNYVRGVGMDVGWRCYFVKKFEKKMSLAAVKEQDVSELTLQREDEEPIVLVMNTVNDLPIASLICPGDAKTNDVGCGQRFGCGNVDYKMAGIQPERVSIVDTRSGVTNRISRRSRTSL